jgi:hypothetical protein
MKDVVWREREELLVTPLPSMIFFFHLHILCRAKA